MEKAVEKGEAKQADLDVLKEKPVTKLSSAGLVYKFFGEEVIYNIAKGYGRTLEEDQVKDMHSHIYKSLILELDANDNGVNQGEELRYKSGTVLPF